MSDRLPCIYNNSLYCRDGCILVKPGVRDVVVSDICIDIACITGEYPERNSFEVIRELMNECEIKRESITLIGKY